MLKNIFIFLIFGVIALNFSSPVFAQTKEWSDLQNEAGFASREYGCVIDDVATIRGIECIIANVLMVIVTLIGLGGFVMMIYGAFRYQISGGNSKGTETARNIITYAVIGLVLALSSYFILNILSEFTGVSLITQFSIPEIKP